MGCSAPSLASTTLIAVIICLSLKCFIGDGGVLSSLPEIVLSAQEI